MVSSSRSPLPNNLRMRLIPHHILLHLAILIVQIPPNPLNFLNSPLLHLAPATIRKHPLEVMEVGQYQLQKHLRRSVDGYNHKDQPCPRRCGSSTSFGLTHNRIDVDEQIGQNCIPEDPKYHNKYHPDTKNTFSV